MKKDEASAETTLSNTSEVLKAGRKDVFKVRDKTRRKRIMRLIAILAFLDAYFIYRVLTHQPFHLPSLGPDTIIWLPLALLFGVVLLMMAMPLMSGRSPHLIVRPEQIDLGLDEVRGLKTQVDEVTRSLDVFLGYATFREELGGTPRRGILFEGPPGTGKTYLAKAMAKQAGVPFLFISAPAFQSMWFGMTAYRRSARSSRLCARPRARKGARSASSRRSTRSAATAARDASPVPGRRRSAGPRRSVSRFDLGRHRRHGERAADPDAVVRPAPVATDHGPA